MGNYEDKSNNELMGDIVNLKAEHEAIKVRILSELDKLDLVEQKFNKINNILEKRIKGDR